MYPIIQESQRVMTLEKEQEVKLNLKKVTTDLRFFSLKLVGNNNQFAANDLYQDTVIRIITNASKYHYELSFKSWAKTIMRNIFIDSYRKEIQIRRTKESYTKRRQEFSENFQRKNNIESKIGFKDLKKMIDALPEYFHRPFWMKFEGYKYYEIAEELNLPIGTVKSQVFDARIKLRKMYNIQFK